MKLELWHITGVRVTRANGDTFNAQGCREYDVHTRTGVLCLKDRARTTFAPGTWTMVQMQWKEGQGPC
jgi:hypothetical protein